MYIIYLLEQNIFKNHRMKFYDDEFVTKRSKSPLQSLLDKKNILDGSAGLLV